MTLNYIDDIKKIITNLAERIGFSVRVSARLEASPEEERVIFSLAIPEIEKPSLLIGQYGNNLKALQYLIRLIARHQLGDLGNFIIDINDYVKNRREYLNNLALKSADRAISSGRNVLLEPMPAADRRLVHLALVNNPGVTTESQGDGDDRKIIVKPTTK